MLLPVVENTAPSVISAAPALPRNTVAASASGVVDCAMPGSVPCATIWISVMIAVTMTIVMISAKGTSRARVARFPCRHGHDLVAAKSEDQRAGRCSRAPPARARPLGTSSAGPHEKDSGDDEDDERHELADRQNVDDGTALTDAADVDRRQCSAMMLVISDACAASHSSPTASRNRAR